MKHNEIIARKFHEIEISILTIFNLRDFIEKLLFEISSKFAVHYIWLFRIEESSIAKYFHNIHDSKLLRTSKAFLSKNKLTNITQNRLTPLLSNNNLNSFKVLIPEASDHQIS